jgi:hypothetical protein
VYLLELHGAKMVAGQRGMIFGDGSLLEDNIIEDSDRTFVVYNGSILEQTSFWPSAAHIPQSEKWNKFQPHNHSHLAATATSNIIIRLLGHSLERMRF